MAIMNNTQLLLGTMLFKGNSKEKIEHILELFQEREIKANATIFMENMPAEALYIIKSGTVRVSMMAGEGEEMGLLLLGPGEFFGELSLVQETNRLVTARAETPAEVLLITRKDFQTLIELERSHLLPVLEEHIAHRVTIAGVTGLMEKCGIHPVKVIEQTGQIRFVNGSAMLRHHFIRQGFLDAWKSILPDEDMQFVFARLEDNLNRLAQKKGELWLTIPMAYIEGEKNV